MHDKCYQLTTICTAHFFKKKKRNERLAAAGESTMDSVDYCHINGNTLYKRRVSALSPLSLADLAIIPPIKKEHAYTCTHQIIDYLI